MSPLLFGLAGGICYGMLDGTIVASTYTQCTDDDCFDVTFTPYAVTTVTTAPPADTRPVEGGRRRDVAGRHGHRARHRRRSRCGNCYWARHSHLRGELMSSVIANNWSPDGGQVIEEITATDVAFEMSDCGT